MRFCHKVWLGAGGSYWHLTQGQRVWTTFPRSFQGYPSWPSLACSNVCLNTAKYRIWGKYLGAPTIVNRTPQSKVMAKSHFWPISPLYLQWKTSNWQHEPIYGTIMLNIVLWASDITSHQVKKRWKSHTIKFCPYLLHIFARSWYFSWFLPTPQCHACVSFRIGLPRRGSLSQSRWSCCQSQSTKLATSSTTPISEVHNNQTKYVRQARQPNSPQQHHPAQHVQPLRQLVLAQRDLRWQLSSVPHSDGEWCPCRCRRYEPCSPQVACWSNPS